MTDGSSAGREKRGPFLVQNIARVSLLGVEGVVSQVERLVNVVNALRDPVSGCPWNSRQTHQSLLPYLIEECWEFVHAAENEDSQNMAEELGDVLLQVLLHAHIAGLDFEDIAGALADKMIRRHSHVFAKSEGDPQTPEEVERAWEEGKRAERPGKISRMKDSLLHLPALHSAWKLGQKSGECNFDWEDFSQVIYKVEEEWQELKEELKPSVEPNLEAVEMEIGDVLFSIVQLARHLGLRADSALRASNRKFLARFHQMEKLIAGDGKELDTLSAKEMDHYWGQVKRERR